MINNHNLHLGIDTGGTFTDGVLFDPLHRQVIRTTKVLTTHHDLRLCVGEVLKQLIPADPAALSFVSLSTTLATNAIAEGKRKPVALLLLGYDPELVRRFNFEAQFSARRIYYLRGSHDLAGQEMLPLDEAGVALAAQELASQVDALAVAAYSAPRDASHEQRTAHIAAEISGLPVVQAHHLSNELDSIRRATTASLNASLLSNLKEFLDAVQEMLASRSVTCPLMIVRGDGSLVEAGYARHRPVEMIHSGPATSAIGGQFLAGIDTALVVDVGGTTTDLSLVEKGNLQALQSAATVGPYRTCVSTIQARSFGLGGDSLITFDHRGNLNLGPERAIPIARLCRLYPPVREALLRRLKSGVALHYSDDLEYWILRRLPSRNFTDPTLSALIERLADGPQRYRDLVKQVGPLPPFYIQELINLEIIDRSGLTPTDLLHLTGEFAPWDGETARAVAEAAACLWHESLPDFIQRIQSAITRQMVVEIIQFLSRRALTPSTSTGRVEPLDHWLLDESLGQSDPILGCHIFLKVPLVGIGAPAKAFLRPVAEALGTEIIFPEHYEVANAVGTVVGNVMTRQTAEVFPCIEGSIVTGYFARLLSEQRKFLGYDQALEYARNTLCEYVAGQVKTAGAAQAEVTCEQKTLWEGMAQLTAWAVGKPD